MGVSGPVYLIDVVRIDEAVDERLIVAWEAARAFLQSKGQLLSAELLRTLRPHGQFRFAHIVEVESVDTWRQLIGDPEFPLPEFPIDNHPGLYEMVHQDETAPGIVVVNAFEIPADAEDASFTGPWHRIHDYMTGCSGHRGARLFRCIGAADFRYLSIASWESEETFAEAIQTPAFADLAPELPFDAHTGVYEVIRS